ncbi:hypothetical protein Q31b_14710 [Novipirellula aureliae]|uniref:Uncharacterized protein n=1 Tax=Novipirellula aureliae TaxID=2527966 RepID=A0A5C6E9W3_9BACT|nr:hypothetical protein [Novipirellula aureliae]TWU43939.1 hypothetical protein Q31b_14710 [Novipirellula aureliae]
MSSATDQLLSDTAVSDAIASDMPTSDSFEPRRLERIQEREKLRTSRFDRVSSLFFAVILFIGTLVLMLSLVWLLARFEFPTMSLVQPIRQGEGPNLNGTQPDFDLPTGKEIEDLLEPTLEDEIIAVTNSVSSTKATVGAVNDSPIDGYTDSGPSGPVGEWNDIVPRFERWQLKFNANNIDGYTSQLDFFQIELGAIGGSIQGVDTVKSLAGSPQKARIVDTENEKRLYFMWTTPGPLLQYDKQLLQKAGIPLPGRMILKFVPENLEAQLAQTEMEYAKANGRSSVEEIAKTVFESQPDGGGYQFEVVDQRYRKPSR